jgi:ABC-type Co2+ transport system permease subunit
MELLFNLSNLFILPFWLLMIFLPRWQGTQRVMHSLWPVAILAVVYTVLFLPQVGSVTGSLLTPSLEGIAALLGTPGGVAVGWVHFLAFDLFVGRWIYLDNRQHPLSAWLVSPALFLTLMAGPLGLLLYLLVRLIRGSRPTTAPA